MTELFMLSHLAALVPPQQSQALRLSGTSGLAQAFEEVVCTFMNL